MLLSPGTRLGPYEVIDLLGAGGMGEVYRARDTRLAREVAIKVLPHDKLADAERQRRFLQEARAASALNHPNIVTLHDIANDSGIDYLVMEHVKGKSLDHLIPARGLPPKEAAGYAQQVASALAAAHTVGIVHRDIKPANVIVTDESQVKVLDFGLAKLVERVPAPEIETKTQGAGLTEAGNIVGTVAYMSPEQAGGRAIDHRSDIFSLGVMLYEMLSGERPFRGGSQVETLHAILREPAPPLSGQSPQMEEILAKSLAKDPKDRYQHAGDFALDLRRLQAALESGQVLAAPRIAKAATRGSSWALALVAVFVLAFSAIGLRLRQSDYFWTNPLTEARITRLTDFEGDELDASISPDGKLVAFLSDRDGPVDAWITQVGAANFTNLTKGQFPKLLDEIAFSTGFSADSTRVWVRGGGTVNGKAVAAGLWTIPAMGGTAQQFFDAAPVNVVWSPEGGRIAYFTGGLNGDSVFVADADGANARRLFITELGAHAHYPIWSPDGNYVYFVKGGVRLAQADVWRVPVAGGKAEQITHHNAAVRYPALMDSRTLVYIAPAADGSGTRLYGMDVERRVAHSLNAGVEQYRSVAASNPAGVGHWRLVAAVANPTSHIWTIPITSGIAAEKNARQLALPSVRAAGPRSGPDFLIYLASKGGNQGIWKVKDAVGVELWSPGVGATLSAPAISHDGQQLCFVVRKAGRGSLFLMSAEGTSRRALAEGLDVQDDPSWSPDGQYVAVAARDSAGEKLFKVRVADGTPMILLKAPAHYPQWSPYGDFILYRQTDKTNIEAVTPEGVPYSTGLPPMQFRNAVDNPYRFLPDGKQIVVLQGQYRQDNFWLADLRTGQKRQITDLQPGLSITSFDLAPDGKSILFDRARQNADIVLIEPNSH